MDGVFLPMLDAVAGEAMLFAAIGFLIGGLDDLAVDAIWIARTGWRLLTVRRRHPRATLADFPGTRDAGRIAIFVPAWDESAVIGAMLNAALARLDHPNFCIFVGTYPNDAATISVAESVAAGDTRLRIVVGAMPGPTTKADCLNTLWRALHVEEANGAPRAKAIVLHDAEDVVHPGELRVFDRLIDRAGLVQLPVLPLVDRGSRWVSGSYCDEFAEAHAKQLVVREALGAGLPLAGVGCAIARGLLDRVAATRNGQPFDAGSLTEDYEFGLGSAAMGERGILARVPEVEGGRPVSVRAYFPASLDAAVRQKARWMVGIALAGWDRLGWGTGSGLAERWMRMRDRRAPLALLVLATAYLAILMWALATSGHLLAGTSPPALAAPIEALLLVNVALLAWRLVVRACFVGQAYGRAEALRSIPRALVGNVIALLAARRALVTYLKMLRGSPPRWDKTAHVFPETLPQ